MLGFRHEYEFTWNNDDASYSPEKNNVDAQVEHRDASGSVKTADDLIVTPHIVLETALLHDTQAQKTDESEKAEKILSKAEEWDLAKQYFTQHPNETKLSKKTSKEKTGHAISASFIHTSNGVVKILDTLGEGGYGKVKRCENERGEYEAIKIMETEAQDIQALTDNPVSIKDSFLTIESVFVKTLNIQHLLTGIFGTAMRDNKYYIRIPLIEGKTLSDLIEDGNLTQSEKNQLALDTAKALQTLHNKGLVHGDIRRENIMVSEQPGRKFIPKLIDYDLTFPLLAGDKVILLGENSNIITPNEAFNIAPEVHEDGIFSAKSDIYGLSTVFEDLNVDPSLVERMKHKDPAMRLSLAEIINTMQEKCQSTFGAFANAFSGMFGTLFSQKPDLSQTVEKVSIKTNNYSALFPLPKTIAKKKRKHESTAKAVRFSQRLAEQALPTLPENHSLSSATKRFRKC